MSKYNELLRIIIYYKRTIKLRARLVIIKLEQCITGPEILSFHRRRKMDISLIHKTKKSMYEEMCNQNNIFKTST